MKNYYIGVDLGGTNIKAALFNRDFEKIGEHRMETKSGEGSEAVLMRILANIRLLLAVADVTVTEINCIGMGIPGLLDMRRGISIFSPNFEGWENVPVKDWFEKQLGIPVFIDNDVRVNLYGEWYFGAGKNKKNVVLLTLGTGLGAGVVADGHVLYGATGSAGEVGHMNMYRDGRPCKCGSSGCLGRYVSALGLLRTVREKIESGAPSILTDWVAGDSHKFSAKMVSDAYDAGDQTARDAFHETGEILGFGLVNIINLYNPEIIIIGGGMSAAGERLLASARTVVSNRALGLSRKGCEIAVAALGDAAGMLGAAVYAAKRAEET